MVYSYKGILRNNDEQTAALHHDMDEFDKHNVDHKKSHTKSKHTVCFYVYKAKKKKKKAKLIYGVRSQNSGYPEARKVINWKRH